MNAKANQIVLITQYFDTTVQCLNQKVSEIAILLLVYLGHDVTCQEGENIFVPETLCHLYSEHDNMY